MGAVALDNATRFKMFPNSSKSCVPLILFVVAGCLTLRLIWGHTAAPHIAFGQTGNGMPTYNLPSFISHNLGFYTAPYSFASFGDGPIIPPELPPNCHVVQVNFLQRHGARFPTTGVAHGIVLAIDKIHAAVAKNPDDVYHTPFAFMVDYKYSLGTNRLVDFGREQSYVSGRQMAANYPHLTANGSFIRATVKDRVLESSRWFKHGFEGGRYPAPKGTLAFPDVAIPIGPNSNNTLSSENCHASKTSSQELSPSPKDQWLAIYATPIAVRLSAYLPSLDLTPRDVNFLMSACGFETAFDNGKGHPSPWCQFFSKTEWEEYEYWCDLEKYWGASYGSPLSRAQGSGWVNELIARLTGMPVHVSGSVNGTLDSDPKTFPIPPLAPNIFADFSSDNNMAHIMAALGILRDELPLSPQGPPPRSRLFVASKLVPFSTSLVVEKLSCSAIGAHRSSAGRVVMLSSEPTYVRMILNGAVVPLSFEVCGPLGLSKGMCPLDGFVKSQSFSTGGGGWEATCSDPAL